MKKTTFDFYKYHGAGNDFILLDNRNSQYNFLHKSPETVKSLCRRHFGIGADGLMLLENSQTSDFSMRYFNSDGNEASMCGNGGRCIALFANNLGIIKENTTFEAIDGIHKATLEIKSNAEMDVNLKMKDVEGFTIENSCYILDTGSPHFVKFVIGLQNMDVYNAGKEIRYSRQFAKKGINVNFVEKKENRLFVRTYERGVENETLACGTGVTAAAIAYSIHENLQKQVNIETLGGNLNVTFERSDDEFRNIWLKGPAKFVFKGNVNI